MADSQSCMQVETKSESDGEYKADLMVSPLVRVTAGRGTKISMVDSWQQRAQCVRVHFRHSMS